MPRIINRCIAKSVFESGVVLEFQFCKLDSPTSLALGCCVRSACVRAGMLGYQLHRHAVSAALLWSWTQAGGSPQLTWDLPEDSLPWIPPKRYSPKDSCRLSWSLENLNQSGYFHWLGGRLLCRVGDCCEDGYHLISNFMKTLQKAQSEVIFIYSLEASIKSTKNILVQDKMKLLIRSQEKHKHSDFSKATADCSAKAPFQSSPGLCGTLSFTQTPKQLMKTPQSPATSLRITVHPENSSKSDSLALCLLPYRVR